jgi:transposase
MIQLAWLWLRHQPQSELSRWFQHRVPPVRIRKTRQRARPQNRDCRAGAQAAHCPLFKPGAGLWRFESHGELPAGAQVKLA